MGTHPPFLRASSVGFLTWRAGCGNRSRHGVACLPLTSAWHALVERGGPRGRQGVRTTCCAATEPDRPSRGHWSVTPPAAQRRVKEGSGRWSEEIRAAREIGQTAGQQGV